MRESTKLKLIGVSIVVFTVAFVAAILQIALTDEPIKDEPIKIEAGEVKPVERAQTYTVQGLSVQTSTTPDILTILILSALA